MADPVARSPPANLYSILGISKTASLADIGKAYKSLIMKWHPDRNASNRAEAEAKFSSINEAYRVLSSRKREETNGSNHDDPKTPENSYHHRSSDDDDEKFVISSPTLLSSTSTRITPAGTPRSSSDGSSHRGSHSGAPSPRNFYGYSRSPNGTDSPPTPTTPEPPPISLSKITSKRATNPIIYSQTLARRKAQPIQKKLECTLEELCHGCVKKVKITRDVISNAGIIVQEEEILRIKVKPGWKKGTKITFEGKGDERPGTLPADIIFIIDEKRHPVFKREGDDLELGVEIPLVQALTGCTISIPLLGGDQMDLSIDDIIFPGYEKVIPDQGMPISKQNGRRGDLRLRFLIGFPTDLSQQQRSAVVSILEDCC